MRRYILILVLLALVTMPQFVKAEETRPVQLAAFDPVQLVPADESIQGLRLSLFYIVNWTEGFMHGEQYGVVNVSKGRSAGMDLGVVNYNDGSFRGVQIGIVNYTKSLDGLQIGLGNYKGNKKPMEFMPIVNWSF